MKFRNILYVFLMVAFMILAYLLIDRGVNAKTKIFVNYKDDSKIIYKVYLLDDKYLGMNDKYNSSLVDKISFNYNFKSIFSTSVNGYYKYNVEGILVAYTDDINDSLLQKKYLLINDVVNPLNNNGNIINVEQNIDINYIKYREELRKISNEYNTLVNGYLELRFNVIESLNFNGIDNTREEKKQDKVIIPLGYDSFKINVINDKKNIDSYYDFSKKQSVNYVLMILGAFSLSLGISFLALVIRNMIISYNNENKYNRKLKEILKLYSDIIVKVKKFYNKKKYNLIYVDNFKELIDVYNKVGNPISFREVKKHSKAIFLLIDDDNAWIYEMNRENI